MRLSSGDAPEMVRASLVVIRPEMMAHSPNFSRVTFFVRERLEITGRPLTAAPVRTWNCASTSRDNRFSVIVNHVASWSKSARDPEK